MIKKIYTVSFILLISFFGNVSAGSGEFDVFTCSSSDLLKPEIENFSTWETPLDDPFEHHSCSFTRCYETCISESWENPSTGEIAQRVLDAGLSCIPGANQAARKGFQEALDVAQDVQCGTTCATANSPDEKGDCARCIISSVAGNLPGGCAVKLWDWAAELMKPHANCIQECSGPPISWSKNWGHECRDGFSADKQFCTSESSTGISIVGAYTCQDCEYRIQGGQACLFNQHCEQTGLTTARCVEDDEEEKPKKPGNDHPDDNYAVSSISSEEDAPIHISNTIFEDTDAAKVAILNRGFSSYFREMLIKSGEWPNLVGLSYLEDIDPQEYETLVIPSGGLYGLESSSTIKSWISRYVANGGNLIVFAQQHGYEFDALPGNVEGYGWMEDQSCQYGSVVISTYHPVFSSQESELLDVNVDGFFTSYPSDSEVLLTRTKNGQPAMILYEYGNGTVLASTLYSDMSKALRMQSADERMLVRDIVTWGMYPGNLESYEMGMVNLSINFTNPRFASTENYPQFSSGDKVNITINVSNYGNLAADRVSFILFDPYYNRYTVDVPGFIGINQSKNISLIYQTTGTSNSGVWSVVYSLYSGENNIYTNFGGEFGLDIQELSNYKAIVTIRDPSRRAVTEKNESIYIQPGQVKSVNLSFNAPSLGIWTARYSVLQDGSPIKMASGAYPFSITKFKESEGGISYHGSKLDLSVTSKEENYPFGAPVEFVFHVWNREDKAKNVTITWGLPHHRFGWDKYFNNTISIGPNEYLNFSYTLPGIHSLDRLRAQALEINIIGTTPELVAKAERGFFVFHPKPGINIKVYKKWYKQGENITVQLNISNPYDTRMSEHRYQAGNYTPIYDISFIYPGANTSNHSDYELNLEPRSSLIRNFTFLIPEDSKTGLGIISSHFYYKRIENSGNIFSNLIDFDTTYFRIPEIPVDVKFSKPAYRIRDSFKANITFIPWNLTLNISIPSLDYGEVRQLALEPADTDIEINTVVPPNLKKGKHTVFLTKIEENITKEFNFFIPNSDLSADLPQSAPYDIRLNNDGGVDADIEYKLLLRDQYMNIIQNESGVGIVEAGKFSFLNISLPNNLISGKYLLNFDISSSNENKSLNFFKVIDITGLNASMESKSGKTVYSPGESINLETLILNNGPNISDGSLRFKILGKKINTSIPCIVPEDDLEITSSITLCPGTYNLKDSNQAGILIVKESGITIQGDPTEGTIINGLGSYSKFIYLEGYSGVTIRNLDIRNFYVGIEIGSSSNNVITDNIITDSKQISGIAIYLHSIGLSSQTNGNIIRGNNFSNNYHGFYATSVGSNNLIDNNIANSNIGYGIYLSGWDYSNVTNNIANSNLGSGIRLSSDYNLIANNTAVYNPKKSSLTDSGIGINLDGSQYNTIQNNNCSNNRYGIYITNAQYNLIKENIANSNDDYGFNLRDDNNVLIRNDANFNGHTGILVYSAINNVIKENDIQGNVNYGVSLNSYMYNTTLEKNVICSNNIDIINSTSHWTNLTGNLNTCDSTDNWNDEGTTGCTNSCAGISSISALNIKPLNINKIEISNSDNALWEKELPGLSISDKLDIPIDVGPLDASGKLYLYSTLYSPSGQIIASHTNDFYILDGDMILTLNTDKEIYKSGEPVNITGTLENIGPVIKDTDLIIRANGTEIFSRSYSMNPGDVDTFHVITSSSSNFTLEGLLDGLTVIEENVRVEEPSLSATISSPDVVGTGDFEFSINLENNGSVPIDINVKMIGGSISNNEISLLANGGGGGGGGYLNQDITLLPGEARVFNNIINITQNTTFQVTITGDLEIQLQKEVVFGEASEIAVQPSMIYLEGLAEIPFTIINTGIIETSFNATFTVMGQSHTKEIYLSPGSNISDSILANLTRGKNIIEYSSPFWSGSVAVNVEGVPEFIVTEMPENAVFNMGESINLNIEVKNIGGKNGTARIKIDSPGLFDGFNSSPVALGEVKNIVFPINVPDDLEDKDYELFVYLGDKTYNTTIHIIGASIEVSTALDKNYYSEGETAILTLDVENKNNIDLDLFSRIQFGENYLNVTPFNLSGNGNMTFNFEVPVSFSDDNKIFFSIYHSSGRSLYINSMFLHEKIPGSPIALYTDKQVYKMDENITIYVDTIEEGNVSIKAPHFNYQTTLYSGLLGHQLINITGVGEQLSGTYYVDYSYHGMNYSYAFDVDGYMAKLTEIRLTGGEYKSGDSFSLEGKVETNRDYKATLVLSLFDVSDKLIKKYSFNQNFQQGDNFFNYSDKLPETSAGLHSMVLKVVTDLKGHSPVTLVSGSEFLDIIADEDGESLTNNPASGSGGGGGGGDSNGATSFISRIGANQTGSVKFSESLSPNIFQINITVKNEVFSVAISVKNLASQPFGTTEISKVYKYIEIKKSDSLANSDIERAVINFIVEKIWLEENTIHKNSVYLGRFNNGQWEKLETAITGENDDYVYYEAITPGFSFFTIVGEPENNNDVEEKEITIPFFPPVEVPEIEEIPKEEIIEEEPSEGIMEDEIEEDISSGFPLLPIFLISILVIVAGTYYWRFMKKE